MRAHVILVPGFAGFDALGQLEYYSGLTPLFRAWQAQGPAAARPVLRFFDNLPTAGVSTRAGRLVGYLARRYARGQLAAGDTVALVGHSTGGLDIRRLLLDLDALGDEPIPVDGPSGDAFTVRPADLLSLVRRVVFVSVPQWGTNLADWLRSYRVEREAMIAELRASVLASRLSPLDRLTTWATGRLARLSRADLLLAVEDAFAEIEIDPHETPAQVAAAEEAAAELGLWLRYMATDFAAIDDLTADPRPGSRSPAHLPAEARDAERAMWARYGIETRSYATVGARPFAFGDGATVDRLRWLDPSTYPERTPATPAAAGMNWLYRWLYRACAGGPFRPPPGLEAATAPTLGGAARPVQIWDNDGIVNTQSMLWPDGPRTVLVDGDHADVIGHYRLLPEPRPSRRRYHTYDLLGSASGFGRSTFESVWWDVLDFAAPRGGSPR